MPSLAKRLAKRQESRAHALCGQRPSSLDAPLSAESITSLGELVPDEEVVIPDRELVDNNMSTLLHALIRLLPDRDVEILTRRFGLNGNETTTL